MVRKLVLSVLLIFAFNVLSVAAQEDLATQVRFGHFVADAANVGVFFNGELIFENYEPSAFSNFIDIDPGRLDVVIVSAGEDIDNPLVKIGGVEIVDGHGYTIALMGQSADDSLRGLVIDENEEIEGCDLSRNVVRITVNNIAGSPPISFYEGDQWIEQNIEYGDYVTACVPPFFADTAWAVAGDDLDDPIFVLDDDEDGYGAIWEPYIIYLWGMMGEYPGEAEEDYYFAGGNSYILAPDAIAFLDAFSGWGLTSDSEIFLEFDQIVQAFRDTGLDEMIREEGPFTLFVPTNQALEALPAKTLNQLMSDTDALRDVLLYHMVEGVYDYEDLADAGALETLQGSELEFVFDEDDYMYLNNRALADYKYTMLDGSKVYFINDLNFLLPND